MSLTSLEKASSPFTFFFDEENKIELAHRLVMAPMTRRRCGPHGIPTDEVAKYYCARSLVDHFHTHSTQNENHQSGATNPHVGFSMIITEGVFINDSVDLVGTAPTIPHIGNDEAVEAWTKVMSKINGTNSNESKNNNCNKKNCTIMQLWHTGRYAGITSPGSRCVGPVESEIDVPSAPPPQQQPSSPSTSTTYSINPSTTTSSKMKVHALSKQELESLVQDYAKAAHNAVHKCGFQGVEPHFAHGYLVDSFMSPIHNIRDDEFGGSESLENRLRFPCMILRAIRDAIGPNALLIPRISQWSVANYEEKKFRTAAELEFTLKKFCEAGQIDGIHISTRRVTDVGFPEEHATRTLAGWATHFLTAFSSDESSSRKRNNSKRCAVIGVGGVCVSRNFAGRDEYRLSGDEFSVLDPSEALDLIEKGEIDLLAVGRAAIPDPEFCGKVLSGNWKSVKCYKPESLTQFP